MSLSRCIPRVRLAQRLKRAETSARRYYSVDVPYFENEPARPVVATSIPGPKARGALEKIDDVFDTNNVNMVTDFERSVGNFIADPEGNLLLDVYAQIASIAVGYNNPALLAATHWPTVRSALVNRPAMGNFPQHDWAQVLQSGLLRAAPNGLDKVFTSTTGSDANELAYKAAFMWKRRQQRGEEADFTAEEVSSAMENKGPGAPNLSILSFKGGFHGRLFGSLTTTRSKPIHKLDIPAFDWPAAPFPQLKYPLEEHARENRDEEKRCLQETERIISEWHNPPAAVIVEPIQSEGGDNHASPGFFRGLRELTKKHDILFIVDEVQTGVGATGKLWAHEHWELSSPPDMVTFSKKAQAAGYFYSDASLRPKKAYRQFNTWMGDPVRAVMFKAMLQEIETKGLVQNTALVGEYLYRGLLRLQERFPSMVTNLRGKGQGTFIAFDCPSRDELIKKSKSVGLNIGGCGEMTIRLRPMLVFQQHHADLLLEMLERLIKR